MKRFIILLFLIAAAIQINAQKLLEKELSGYTNPEELVTLSSTIPFDQAIGVLSQISEKLTGKKIVTTSPLTDPIGIEIDKMPYMKALLIISQVKNLIYEEKAEVIVVKSKEAGKEQLSADIYAPVSEREVKISAVFFEANITEMRERGINWEFLLSQSGLSIGSKFQTFTEGQTTDGEGTSSQNPPDFTGGTTSDFDMGNFKGNATALFRFFETENLGEIISRPSVTVRDKQEGRIQIGSDISIKQRDFAGNVIDVFISTGTIIQVTPYIYSEDGVDYVLLKLNVERSSAQPSDLTTEIRKTSATTEALMLNGEETVIGGLFVNEETDVRRGIPILKDLPWWVFGIRYLTGYDQKQVSKREVIILIKAEIVPTLKERISKQKENEIEKLRNEHKEILEKFRTKKQDETEEVKEN